PSHQRRGHGTPGVSQAAPKTAAGRLPVDRWLPAAAQEIDALGVAVPVWHEHERKRPRRAVRGAAAAPGALALRMRQLCPAPASDEVYRGAAPRDRIAPRSWRNVSNKTESTALRIVAVHDTPCDAAL